MKVDYRNKCIIWGAGYCGGIALEAYGHDNVLCFGDSDERNVGLFRWGKEIVSFNKMITLAKMNDIRIIIASEDYGNEMKMELERARISNYDLFRSEYARVIVKDRKDGISPITRRYDDSVSGLYHPELEKFKGIHSGKRIFIIGNGPSLRAEDLDKLYCNQEICFAFNNIHKIYGRTLWRPNYYSIVDFYGFLLNKEKLESYADNRFLWDIFEPWLDSKQTGSNYFFHYERRGYTMEYPEFSSDFAKGVYLGYTSVYDVGIQVAAYMGASEIYLLGVDHNYPNKSGHDGNHFDGYFEPGETRFAFFPIENIKKGYEADKAEMAYKRAEMYSKEHGFRIFNATRGGCLEVFERVNFDDLFDT